MSLVITDDGDPVGTIGLDDPNPDRETAGIGYLVHPDHWSEGYATGATALLTRFAVDERRLATLYATVFEHNLASMRVLEKAGYEEEAVLDREAHADGRRVDCHRYAAHADGWAFPLEVENADWWTGTHGRQEHERPRRAERGPACKKWVTVGRP